MIVLRFAFMRATMGSAEAPVVTRGVTANLVTPLCKSLGRFGNANVPLSPLLLLLVLDVRAL